MELLHKTTNLALYYAPDLYSVCAIWTGKINSVEFRTGADMIETALRKYRTGKLITCSSPMHIVDREATAYLAQEWLPRVAGGILHYWADVVPSLQHRTGTHGQINSTSVTVEEQYAIPGIVLAQFPTVDGAKIWLKTK